MEKIYLFTSVFYDKTGIQYLGTDGKRSFRKLEDAISYGDKIHKMKVKEFEMSKNPFTHKIKEFVGSIKRSYIIEDPTYTFINTIEEITLV